MARSKKGYLAELDPVEPLVDAEMTAPKKLTAAQTNRDAKIPAWIQAARVVLLASVGFAFWCGHMDSDLGHLQKDVARIDTRMDAMNGILLTLLADKSPRRAFEALGTLQPKQLSDALPALQRITEQPVAEVAPQPAALREVAVNLRLVNEGSPNYWSIVLGFIRWASNGMSPDAPPPGSPNLELHRFGARPFGAIRNKIVVLDEVDIQDGEFDNCRIIFTGKPSVLKRIMFVNCVFEFPITDQPSVPLKRISEQLLAGGIEHALVESL
jgi:hypothetical protein